MSPHHDGVHLLRWREGQALTWMGVQVAMWRSILRFLDPYTGSRTDCSRGPRHVRKTHVHVHHGGVTDPPLVSCLTCFAR